MIRERGENFGKIPGPEGYATSLEKARADVEVSLNMLGRPESAEKGKEGDFVHNSTTVLAVKAASRKG